MEEALNPWITVSKKKGIRAFTPNDALKNSAPRKGEIESQANAFIHLSIEESETVPGAFQGLDLQNGNRHRPPTPSGNSPPRKKPKKDPMKSHYPTIKINDNAINQQVSLTDFRDLVLWMLDDTTRPDWVEIANKSYVKAVVVLLVPGLSPGTFHVDPKQGSEGRRMRRLKELETPPSLSHFSDIFLNMWLPKAPGTNTQLYSPVSAFLNCPLTSAQSLQRARERSQRKVTNISAQSLLLPANDMKIAGYPTHPLHEEGSEDPTYVHTPYKTEPSDRRKTIIGLDCEMCITEQGSEITRVTLVDFQGKTLYDELVKPENPILDYLTPWSGITEERLLNTTTTLSMIQSALLQILDSDTILVGHSLECDLQALKLAHPHVIDTSVIYQHSRGPPYKPSLKWLAHKWLQRKIQDNNIIGHDSAEDATACIDLLKLKLRRGKEFGLFNVDMESLFTRLKRRGIDSAVVEYGTRGDAFYGDKVRSCVSAESDEEVIDGILESIQTGHGFVWSRLKDVENAAKWKDNESAETTKEDMEPALMRFDANIQRLWEGLPPCTALMVVSGSGDPREMSRLFAKKKNYEAELRVKRYDDIQVKWMDEDQQAYTMAVDTARTGLGFINIK